LKSKQVLLFIILVMATSLAIFGITFKFFLTRISLHFLMCPVLNAKYITVLGGEWVRIPGDYQLAGVYYPPKRPGAPVIIICHGNNQTVQNTFRIAEWLHNSGFAVLTFDYRGFGLSKGRLTSFGELKKDLLAVINYVSGKSEINTHKIGLLGLSLGTAPAIQVAASNPRICGLVLHGPVFSGERLIDNIFHDHMLSFYARYFADMEGLTSCKAISQIRCPLLIIQEEKDEITTRRDGQSLFRLAHSPKTIWLVPGFGHLKTFRIMKDDYRERLVNFFRNSLNWQTG
jgi:alpha-beta hydrolase superfamily lysophospholipase